MDRCWLLNGIPYGDGEIDGQVLDIERNPLRGWRERKVEGVVY